MDVYNYDPEKITVAVDGRVLTGFAADGVVTIVRNEDSITPSVGSKGDVVITENANKSGTATIPLMSSSSSLAYLRDLCERRKPIQLMVSDANDGTPQVNAESCRITKLPDIPKGKDAATVTVTVFIPRLTYH